MDRSLLAWLLIGVVVGVIGKLLMPEKDPDGLLVSVLIGIAGALLAGTLASSLSVAVVGGWKNRAAAAGGAVLLLALYRIIVSRRTR